MDRSPYSRHKLISAITKVNRSSVLPSYSFTQQDDEDDDLANLSLEPGYITEQFRYGRLALQHDRRKSAFY